MCNTEKIILENFIEIIKRTFRIANCSSGNMTRYKYVEFQSAQGSTLEVHHNTHYMNGNDIEMPHNVF